MKASDLKTRKLSFWLPALVAVSGLVSTAVSPSYLRGQGSAVQVGYSVVTPGAGTRRPIGTALFSVTNNQNVLVSQAGVEGVEPFRRGRFFVDEEGSRTGVALVNPGPLNATALLTLRDSTGLQLLQVTRTLQAGRHLAAFVDELFQERPAGMRGSVTFESDQPLGSITLRETLNRYSEPLYATLPVVDLDAAPNSNAVVFPHLAVGEGYRTQLLLINRGAQRLQGRVRFWDLSGQPLMVGPVGSGASEIAYQIDPEGAFRAELDSPSLRVGYAVVTPDPGNTSPAGTAIFQFREQGKVVTEASVAATLPTTRARIFVDHAISRTGLAVANAGSLPAELTLVLMDRFGGVEGTTTKTVPAGGHLAQFAHELFPGYLTEGFNGLLEIQSSTPVSPITLKLTTNSRNETVLTTLPVADLERPPGTAPALFPQIAIGSIYSTRLIFITPDSTSVPTGSLAFFQSDGSPMVIPMRGQVNSQFPYQFTAGGGSQLYPGNTASVVSLQVVDPAADLPSTEIAINVGGSVRPRTRIIDSSGTLRGDFDVQVQSLDTTVASVNSNGSLQGEREGFATLTLTSGGVVTTTTAAVVRINAGAPGFNIKGVAQDRAARLYLAATTENTVLLAQDVRQIPGIYAGIPRSAGLKNGPRLESQFQAPSFLALNQQNGDLYVSDGANHVIRRVRPGAAGVVETLAGTGVAGSQNGTVTAASFNNPQGIALDSRGNLWVADSGNHAIRRINLVTRTVETIAGLAGEPGFTDGRGQEARFRGVVGVAIVAETAERETERLRRNEPPPPVQVLVADSGNNAIRRVMEDGRVETLSSTNVTAIRADGLKPAPVAPLLFNAPAGLALDPFGNIFVTETSSGQVKTILQTGTVVSATQRSTFASPGGIAITSKGSVIVAEGNRAAQEIVYGEPAILAVSPNRVSDQGGTTVTITGKNFAPDSLVIVGGFVMNTTRVVDTQTISFTSIPLPSGVTTLTVQNRGGLAQTSLLLHPVPLSDLTPGKITTVAGGTTFIGDGSSALSAGLGLPEGAAVDVAGNLFFADTYNHRVRKVNAATGIITTVAGSGEFDFSGDGGPATAAAFKYPVGVAVDAAGNIFIADGDTHRVRKVSAVTGFISSVAGTGDIGSSGDGGLATAALLDYPVGVAVDGAGNLFIADTGTHRVRRVNAATGIISTVAGTGVGGFSGDGGPATAALLDYPSGVAVDSVGNLFIADTRNYRVRMVTTTGLITTVAGSAVGWTSLDGGPATAASLKYPVGISFDAAGNMFISDRDDHRVRKVTPNGTISTVAGTGAAGFSGDGGTATTASLNAPKGIAADSAGNLFIADTLNNKIRKVTAATGTISTVAGASGVEGITGEGGLATAASFGLSGIAIDGPGNLLIGSYGRVLKVAATTGIISTFAGNGSNDSSGDGGPATSAAIGLPIGLAVDSGGNLFMTANGRVRKVAAGTGTISTVAGTGADTYSGDGGPATSASLYFPAGIALNDSGDLFIVDRYNFRIRKVTAATGSISTVAGSGVDDFFGDNGPATAAAVKFPIAIVVDGAGNLFFSDTGNNRVRKVTAATGIISTVAGTGAAGFSGDGGHATAAALNDPKGLAFDAAGNLFIADSDNNRIRKVNATTGVITTVTGAGVDGLAGDGGAAAAAFLSNPEWIAIDGAGNLFIADTNNYRIRAVRAP